MPIPSHSHECVMSSSFPSALTVAPVSPLLVLLVDGRRCASAVGVNSSPNSTLPSAHQFVVVIKREESINQLRQTIASHYHELAYPHNMSQSLNEVVNSPLSAPNLTPNIRSRTRAIRKRGPNGLSYIIHDQQLKVGDVLKNEEEIIAEIETIEVNPSKNASSSARFDEATSSPNSIRPPVAFVSPALTSSQLAPRNFAIRTTSNVEPTPISPSISASQSSTLTSPPHLASTSPKVHALTSFETLMRKAQQHSQAPVSSPSLNSPNRITNPSSISKPQPTEDSSASSSSSDESESSQSDDESPVNEPPMNGSIKESSTLQSLPISSSAPMSDIEQNDSDNEDEDGSDADAGKAKAKANGIPSVHSTMTSFQGHPLPPAQSTNQDSESDSDSSQSFSPSPMSAVASTSAPPSVVPSSPVASLNADSSSSDSASDSDSLGSSSSSDDESAPPAPLPPAVNKFGLRPSGLNINLANSVAASHPNTPKPKLTPTHLQSELTDGILEKKAALAASRAEGKALAAAKRGAHAQQKDIERAERLQSKRIEEENAHSASDDEDDSSSSSDTPTSDDDHVFPSSQRSFHTRRPSFQTPHRPSMADVPDSATKQAFLDMSRDVPVTNSTPARVQQFNSSLFNLTSSTPSALADLSLSSLVKRKSILSSPPSWNNGSVGSNLSDDERSDRRAISPIPAGGESAESTSESEAESESESGSEEDQTPSQQAFVPLTQPSSIRQSATTNDDVEEDETSQSEADSDSHLDRGNAIVRSISTPPQSSQPESFSSPVLSSSVEPVHRASPTPSPLSSTRDEASVSESGSQADSEDETSSNLNTTHEQVHKPKLMDYKPDIKSPSSVQSESALKKVTLSKKNTKPSSENNLDDALPSSPQSTKKRSTKRKDVASSYDDQDNSTNGKVESLSFDEGTKSKSSKSKKSTGSKSTSTPKSNSRSSKSSTGDLVTKRKSKSSTSSVSSPSSTPSPSPAVDDAIAAQIAADARAALELQRQLESKPNSDADSHSDSDASQNRHLTESKTPTKAMSADEKLEEKRRKRREYMREYSARKKAEKLNLSQDNGSDEDDNNTRMKLSNKVADKSKSIHKSQPPLSHPNESSSKKSSKKLSSSPPSPPLRSYRDDSKKDSKSNKSNEVEFNRSKKRKKSSNKSSDSENDIEDIDEKSANRKKSSSTKRSSTDKKDSKKSISTKNKSTKVASDGSDVGESASPKTKKQKRSSSSKSSSSSLASVPVAVPPQRSASQNFLAQQRLAASKEAKQQKVATSKNQFKHKDDDDNDNDNEEEDEFRPTQRLASEDDMDDE